MNLHADGKPRSRRRGGLRIKDDYLACVLECREFLLLDGGMGTMLQRSGLAAGEQPELLCLTDPQAITGIHEQYVKAGSQAVTTNTFGANKLKLEDRATVGEVFEAAVSCARAANPQYVAADIGPLGALLQPMGTLAFEEAYRLFAEQVQAADGAGADLLIIETMADLKELKAAVLAAKEYSDLPIIASMTFGEDGRTFLGTSPSIAARTLDALGADIIGVNCSLGPSELQPLVQQILDATEKPVIMQANAGLPSFDGEAASYSITPSAYVESVLPCVEAGVTVLGGCCGTDPDYIAGLAALLEGREAFRRQVQAMSSLTSAQCEVLLGDADVAVIGERINPTGKRKLQQALRQQDFNYVASEAIAQAAAGADLLDVNAGLPDIDEAAVLAELVMRLQGVCALPFQIDSADPGALRAAARVYAGKPLLNSVNGKEESLRAVLPIAAEYGCAVLGLTLDERGIPHSAEERLEIARRIVERAADHGIPAYDVYIDCLVMSASTNQRDILEILRAIPLVKRELGVKTVLGVSNVSFGLPGRPVINAAFLSAAFQAGLDLPIINPLSEPMMDTVASWRVLCGQDLDAAGYIERMQGKDAGDAVTQAAGTADEAPLNARGEEQMLFDAVLVGDKEKVGHALEAVLAKQDPLEVIRGVLVPALDEVGSRFEAGTIFLPQLMSSAEAAKSAFDKIHEGMSSAGEPAPGQGSPIVLATVKGDIHDIGKNIVRMLLQNYGYQVIDLGRDVDPQKVVEAVQSSGAQLVGLSALMTTTLAGMQETIELLRQEVSDVRIVVGGAVLNPEYAQMVGADRYAKDAAETVRFAEQVIGIAH